MLTTRQIAGAALVAAAMSFSSSAAFADWALNGSCVGGWGMRTCVLNWRDNPRDPHVRSLSDSVSEQDLAEARERDRKWVGHCRPVLVRDRYGVERYRYARRGCEFGRAAE